MEQRHRHYQKGWDDAIAAASELHWTQFRRFIFRGRWHITYNNIIERYFRPPKEEQQSLAMKT
jgi:hypothetical protein